MSADIIFDGWAADFERAIYDSSKGSIRLKVLWHDLTERLPRLQEGNWHILGDNNLTLYDGSMGEWAKDETLPIEKG